MVTLTVLKVSEPNCLAAKTISLNDAGQAQPDKFKIGTWFHYEQREVDGIKSLSTLLFDMANDRYAFVIREQLAKGKDPTKLVKRLGVKGHGKDGFFESSPTGQPWILLDFDGIPLPSAINFIEHPAQGIGYLVSLLPPYFHKASYHYHLSSRAGLDGGKTIRAHIWYWLDHSVPNELLKQWAKEVNSFGKLIDPSLFDTVHPHYTADPIFKGVNDPFPTGRSAMLLSE